MSYLKTFFRLLLGLFMTYAGFSHLTFNRQEFVAQVPTWLQFSEGFTWWVHYWPSSMSPSSLATSTSTSITSMPLDSTLTTCVSSACSFSPSLSTSLFGALEVGNS